MIYHILYNYRFFSILSNFNALFLCLSYDKKDSVLLLENPQQVYLLDINKSNYDIISSDLSLNSDFIKIHNQQVKNNLNSTINFEKKNKNHNVSDDHIANKKNRIGNRKKRLTKIDLHHEDLIIEESSMENEVNDADLEFSLVRPVRSKKRRKKQKLDMYSSNTSLIDTHINKNINSENLHVVKEVILDSPLTIQELSDKLQIQETSIITWLFLQGISVTVNQVVDTSIATKVAKHYNFNILNSASSDSKVNYEADNNLGINNLNQFIKRAPIITIFGHVDHGKTTLLDYIRQTNLADKEAGGITQAITGYEVKYRYLSTVENLIFLDTPGHEAFTSVRQRGIEVTDIAILLVAADDGLKPQTIESINYIKSNNIPCIIAINKIDKPGVNVDLIKEKLATYDIVDNNKGGKTTILSISALQGINIDTLLFQICQLSHALNLRSNLYNKAQGMIIESYLSKNVGFIAILVVKNGTLNLGDVVISGETYGKVRSIVDSLGQKVQSISASAIAQVSGFSSLPKTGIEFYSVDNEKTAKHIIAKNLGNYHISATNKTLNSRVTLESYANDKNIKKINIILKADKQGSLEAIMQAFLQIPQKKVQINIITYNSGSVFENDIDLAITSKSIIIGFNIHILPSIYNLAKKLKVTINNFNIIYNLLDYVEQYMLSLVEPEYNKLIIGEAIVKTVFYMNKGNVAGCLVNIGTLRQGSYIIVYRDNHIVYEGTLTSLRRRKDDVHEVLEGNECGIMCSDYDSWQEADRIEAFEITKKEKVL